MPSARVLIIEDNPRIGDKLVEVLGRAGFVTELGRDGREGLALFRAERPDLVVLEHVLPGIPEGRAVDELRRLDAEVPIIVMAPSGHAQIRLQQQGEGFVQGFLVKPFRVPDLLVTVELALSGVDAGPAPRADAAVELRGVLRGATLSELFLTLLRGGRTGILRLFKDGARRDVYWLNGLPVFAESNLLSETFGRYLLARGRLDESQYATVRRYMQTHGVRQGEALVALEILNNHEVYGLLRGQVRERVARCFTWEGAEYAFFDDAAFVDDKLMFPMNPLALLVDGALRRRTPQELQRLFDRLRDEPLAATPLAAEVRLFLDRLHREPSLWDVLSGGPTVGALQTALRLVEPRVAALVAALLEAGLLVVGADALAQAVTLPAVAAETAAEPADMVLEAQGQLDPEHTTAADDESERVLARYLATRGGDHYAVLGLPREATDGAIEAAYTEVCRGFHPDRFADHPDPEIRLRAKEVFIKAGQAFGILSDPRARARYLEQLTAQATWAGVRYSADDELLRGETLAAEGRMPEARLCFARAHADAPGEPLFAAWLGYATALCAKDEDEVAEGETLLREALRQDPCLDVAHDLLARLYAATGRQFDSQEPAARAGHLRAQASGLGLQVEPTIEES